MTPEQETVQKMSEALASWDGKSAKSIGEIYQAFHQQPAFIAALIQLISQPPAQNGATWMLKHHFEAKNHLDEEIIKALYGLLFELKEWQSQLHILQSMPYMPIPESQKKTVEQFLRVCLSGQNKFVRAWSYNGFYELARQFPEYQAETEQFFEMALRDEAASVKARVRQLVKKGF